MNKAKEKDLFAEWALYGPQEQKMMIDEYISISAGACSRERFLKFLKDKLKMDGKRREVGMVRSWCFIHLAGEVLCPDLSGSIFDCKLLHFGG